MRPRFHEVQYFLQRVEQEIDRNRNIRSHDQLADYYHARKFWQQKLKAADAASTSSE